MSCRGHKKAPRGRRRKGTERSIDREPLGHRYHRDDVGTFTVAQTANEHGHGWFIFCESTRPRNQKPRNAALWTADLICARCVGIIICAMVRIWTPPHLQANRLMDDEVRLLTYIRSLTTASLRFVRCWTLMGYSRANSLSLTRACRTWTTVRVLPAPVRPVRHHSVCLASVVDRHDSFTISTSTVAISSTLSRHTFGVVVGPIPYHRPGDSRRLVRHRHRRYIAMPTSRQARHPLTQPVLLALRGSHHRAAPVDQ